MSAFTPVPKPLAAPTKARRGIVRSAPPRRSTGRVAHHTRLKARNERAASRRHAHYQGVLRSSHHRQMRYAAFLRSGGLCECAPCVAIRAGQVAGVSLERIAHAFAEIPVWFVNGGGEAWKRFRSTAGELHHKSYKYFGQENPAELEVVSWTWGVCHGAIESQHPTRRTTLAHLLTH